MRWLFAVTFFAVCGFTVGRADADAQTPSNEREKVLADLVSAIDKNNDLTEKHLKAIEKLKKLAKEAQVAIGEELVARVLRKAPVHSYLPEVTTTDNLA